MSELGKRPNGYPETYRTALAYLRAKEQTDGYYWDAELEEYRHFHGDGSDHRFTVCLCGRVQEERPRR